MASVNCVMLVLTKCVHEQKKEMGLGAMSMKKLMWLRFPLLIIIAIWGIVTYNGENIVKVDNGFSYRQYNNFDHAERFLRENFNMSVTEASNFIAKDKGNYMFFQAGMMFDNLAPFQMTFLYEGSFPVDKEHVYWHAVDDRFSLESNEVSVYQKDKDLFLKISGDLVFTPRPGIDSMKVERLKKEGYEAHGRGYAKAISYDLKLTK